MMDNLQRHYNGSLPSFPGSPQRSPKPVIPLCYQTPTRRESERDLPTGSPDFSSYSTDAEIPKPPLKRRSTYSFEKTERVQNFLWRVIYFVVILAWASAYRHYRHTSAVYHELVRAIDFSKGQSGNSTQNLATLTRQVTELEKRLESMQKVNHAFRHEIRMIEEMASERVDMHISEKDMKETRTMMNWVHERKMGLESRVAHLVSGLQEKSKQAVLEKYGPGPYRVKFKIKVVMNENKPQLFVPGAPRDISSFVTQKGMSMKKDFVVELAPLDLMPHSIHLFLDLVSNKLWDDTVFLHNDDMLHLMAAAPIHYSTHNLKTNHLAELPFQKLGFPEYSSQYPHEKYTLGFASHGPTFYVNTQDNKMPHGPGGQGHHLLPGDADPCFGRIISGEEIFERLVAYGPNAENRLNPQASHPWTDQNLAWTRIISVEIV